MNGILSLMNEFSKIKKASIFIDTLIHAIKLLIIFVILGVIHSLGLPFVQKWDFYIEKQMTSS